MHIFPSKALHGSLRQRRGTLKRVFSFCCLVVPGLLPSALQAQTGQTTHRNPGNHAAVVERLNEKDIPVLPINDQQSATRSGRSLRSSSGSADLHNPAQGVAALRNTTAFAPFLHGVASGDPLPDRVIIWTRVSPDWTSEDPIEVTWRLSTEVSMTDIAAQGVYNTGPERDFTVKIDAQGLEPNTHYYYQFEAMGRKSLIGRTLTSSHGPLDRLRIAAVSCSDYRRGYFHAYAKLAERSDLSLILHLGDYFYEGGGGSNDRIHEPDAEIYRLQDYRTRYSQYRLDPDLQRVHQVHPFATIWDDHDIVVDALRDTCYRHNPVYGPYRDRKLAAVRAALEWLPIRDDPADSLRIWRSFPYGDMADIYMLDTRLYDRDRFATDAADPIYQSPDHRLIGPVQMEWLQNGLAGSGARWKVLGNQVMMGHFEAIEDEPLIFENWQGYTAEQNAFYQFLKDHEIENTVVLTGDFHISMALDLAPDPRKAENYNPANGDGSLAVEFLVPSVTGVNFDEGETFGFSSATQASFLINLGNKHIKWNELEGHGYVLLDLNAERAQAEFWHMADIRDPLNREEYPLQLWETLNGSQKVRPAQVLSEPIEGIAPLPPVDTVAPALYPENTLISVGPNPFSEEFSMVIWLPLPAELALTIYDAQGRRVADMPAQAWDAGNYRIVQGAQSWAAGTYIADLRMGSERKRIRLVKGRP